MIDGDDFAATLRRASAPACASARSDSSSRSSICCPRSSARSNIEIAHDIAGTTELRPRRTSTGSRDLLGITKRLTHRPSELSGGEQQRVALARALINKPAIVLADEPTGNLDSKNSEIVLNMLRQSNQELGQTVLMITHNPEAAEYGDRIIHMRDGEIVLTRSRTRSGPAITKPARRPSTRL